MRILEDSSLEADSDESYAELVEMRVKCTNNMAAAQLKVALTPIVVHTVARLADHARLTLLMTEQAETWDGAIKSCESVIRMQPNNCKAHFRKGKVP